MSHRVYPAAYEITLPYVHDQGFGGFARGPVHFGCSSSALVTAMPTVGGTRSPPASAAGRFKRLKVAA